MFYQHTMHSKTECLQTIKLHIVSNINIPRHKQQADVVNNLLLGHKKVVILLVQQQSQTNKTLASLLQINRPQKEYICYGTSSKNGCVCSLLVQLLHNILRNFA